MDKNRSKVTLATVARKVGVSTSLVSAVLTGRSARRHLGGEGIGFTDSTARRILAVCRELGYQPRDMAAQIRIHPENGDFVFLLCNSIQDGVTNPYFARMFTGAIGELQSGHHQISVGQYDETSDYLTSPNRLPTPFHNRAATKFIVTGNVNFSLLLAIQRQQHAVVYLSRFVPHEGVISIVPDFAEAARLTLRHLADLGHRRIGIVGAQYFLPDAYNTREFLRGCAEVANHRELTLSPAFERINLHDPPSITAHLRTLLHSRDAPTALFCLNDETANAVVQAAQQLRLPIPERLSISGCQNDTTAVARHPFLTTVHYPCEEMGRLAVAELNRAFSRTARKPRRLILPVRLIVRETTGTCLSAPRGERAFRG